MNRYPFLDELLKSYPGAAWDFKAEWGWDRYQVGGKMFAATCKPGDEHPVYGGQPLLTLKCDPLRAQALRELSGGCILWDVIEENTRRYAYTLLHLYKTDDAFRTAFCQSKGVCLPDMALLLEMAQEALSGDTLARFVKDLNAVTSRSLAKIEQDLEGFTLKFDYRNADKPWGDSKGALERTVNKLQGWCLGEEPNPK